MKLGGAVAVVVLSACVAVPATAHAQACQWKRTNLPTGGMTSVGITGGSRTGWVVGNGSSAAGDAAVVWFQDTVRVRLDFTESTTVRDANEDGVLAGATSTTAFRWINGTYQYLPSMPGDTRTWAQNINAGGDIVGLSGGSVLDAVVVWLGGSPGLFYALPGTDNGQAWRVIDIDRERRVVAWQITPENNAAGFIWDSAGNRTALQPLPGHASAEPQAFHNGHIVGLSAPTHSPTGRQLVEWDLTGKIVRTFPDGYALDVNAAGHILGWKGDLHALWRSETSYDLLPVEGWAPVLTNADNVYGATGTGPYRLSCV